MVGGLTTLQVGQVLVRRDSREGLKRKRAGGSKMTLSEAPNWKT